MKTLKDMPKKVEHSFESFTETEGVNPIRIEYVSVERLRKEAVKELRIVDHPINEKEMIKVLELDKKCNFKRQIDNALFGVRRYLIWKNNLTEEDLK